MKNSAFSKFRILFQVALFTVAGLQASKSLASVDRVDFAYHCAGIGTSKGMNAEVLVGADLHGARSAQIKVGTKVREAKAIMPKKKQMAGNTNILFKLPNSNSMRLEYQLLYGGRHMRSGAEGGYLTLKTAAHGSPNAVHNLFLCSRKAVVAAVAGDDEYAWVRGN